MFFVLHRYIFRELMRVFGLTTVALTLILSLGSILRPIQDYGVGPQQVVRLLIYFLPVTLTFVLPMAALFAAALSYGRLSGDNEIDACKASGISPLTLVYPGFVLALLVAMANLGLSFHVMPGYMRKAEKAIKADARQILFRNLKQKGYYSLPGQPYRIYADYANLETSILSGVVVVQARGNGISDIYSTEDARVTFTEEDDQTVVRIDTYNVRQIIRPSNYRFRFEGNSMEVPFGSLLEDKVVFKRLRELKRIQANPLGFRPIGEKAGLVREQLVLELLLQEIQDVIAAGRSYTLQGDPNRVRLNAQAVSLGIHRIDLAGQVTVEEVAAPSGKTLRTLTCKRGSIDLDTSNDPPTLTVALENASRSDSVGIVMRYPLRNLRLPADLQPYFGERQLTELLSDRVFADLRQGPSNDLKSLHQSLLEKVNATMADIRSEMHSRLVFGLGCIPMILIGIGLGIVKRGGHMLSAFGASCIPALILVVAIVSGKQVTENPGVGGIVGVTLIWSGLVALWIICAGVYRKLLRN